MGNKILNRFVKHLIVFAMGAGLAVSAFILWQMGHAVDRLAVERFGSHALTVFAVMLGLLFVLGALSIGITLYRMMCSLDGDPFVEANVHALRHMGVTALSMELCCLLLLIMPANTIFAQLIGAAVALCGLFSLVLAEVFAAAVAHKQELDLTV